MPETAHLGAAGVVARLSRPDVLDAVMVVGKDDADDCSLTVDEAVRDDMDELSLAASAGNTGPVSCIQGSG